MNELPTFCHLHDDCPSDLTLKFAKNGLTLFPLVIKPSYKYHETLILSIIEKERKEDFLTSFREKANITSFQELTFWNGCEEYIRSRPLYDRHWIGLILVTALHDKEPCITRFCFEHNILFRYHCIQDGKDYFSLVVRPVEERITRLRRGLSKIGDLNDEDRELREMKALTGEITTNNFDRLLFFVFKRLGLNIDDLRVYLKARSCNLFLNNSEAGFEKCSYDLGMHPNEFRKRYWRTVKLTSPFIASLTSALLGGLL